MSAYHTGAPAVVSLAELNIGLARLAIGEAVDGIMVANPGKSEEEGEDILAGVASPGTYFDQAYVRFRKLLRKRPGYIPALILRAESLAVNGRFKRAARIYRNLIRQGVRNSHVYTWLGFVYHKMGQGQKAVSAFNTSIDLDTHSDSVFYARRAVQKIRKKD